VSPTETTDAAKTDTTKKDIKREISVEIPAAEVARETEVQIQRYQKSARLPGFRSGHVPASIIKQRFGDGLKNDVAEALIPKYFRREAEKQGLIPVSQPRVTDLHMHDGEPLTFKASFEVLPEIQVEGYKDLRADHPEIAVTDEEVEQALTTPARAACDLYYRGGARACRGRLCPGFDGREAEGWQGCRRRQG
jgi:trigger factor